ncbi:conserved hypothetical protein [Oleispira antarctica RB-8]|uniref:Uncharacterized protein n=1 Tax=Oleispira antarctica RB-8 TaxID=698738 RepID=R4YNQ9_OLEAN|nr:conserved hypothetical protein [Oleispira antarctica RB-8]
MLSNEKEPLCVKTDKSNSLVINLSQYFGYDCIIEISSWDKGIAWTGIADSEIQKITDISEIGIPFVAICNTEEANVWLVTFPEGLQEKLLEYELKYRGTLYVLLWFISRSQYARELFETSPLLVWIILKTAQSQCWGIEFILNLFSYKRTKILAACGLDESNAVLKIIQKLTLKHFSQHEFELIAKYDWQNVAKHLSHLPLIDGRLLKFLKKYPKLETSTLIQKFSAEWKWHEFEMTFKDTLRMADDLAAVNIMTRIRSCKDLRQLTNLHDRLVSELNDKVLQDIPMVEYGVPPIPETPIIVPITNNRDLHMEGKIQHHCIFVYHNRIARGEYFAYQILEPERATLGLNKTVAGGYSVDQIYLKYNGIVSDATRELVKVWLNSSIDECKMVGS